MDFIKNSIHTVKIKSYSSVGEGIGRLDNYVIFVKGAMVGETVEVKLIKVKKNYAYARLQKVISPSKNRIKPKCEFASACGGCNLLHMSYDEELKFKLKKVNDALSHIAKIDFEVPNIYKAEDNQHYRNKAIFPVAKDKNDKVKIGLFQNRSHNVIDIDKCLIQSPQAELFIEIVRQWMTKYNVSAYNEQNNNGSIRHIYIRTNYKGQTLLCLVSNIAKIPHIDKLICLVKDSKLECVGLVQNINSKKTNVILAEKYKVLYGQNYIQDKICNLYFKLSIPSFFQVNRQQAEKLYNLAIEFAQALSDDIVLDLYCGTGTISLLFAGCAKYVIAVDIVKEAIINARDNAKANNIDNIEFICADTSVIAKKFVKQNFRPEIICVDPPRAGLDRQALDAIVSMQPKNLIYISCNPASLARDLKVLYDCDYKITKASAIDMFPRTSHVETIVKCEISYKKEFHVF